MSIDDARTVVGVFLLLFGLKWLHKAILRSSGLKSLHDEAKIFEETKVLLEVAAEVPTGLDRAGVTTALGGVFLEGLEVVFIVVALGGLQDIPSAVIGALVALLVVAGAGVAFRHPLTRVPENAMKYVVGIMLTSFGTFLCRRGDRRPLVGRRPQPPDPGRGLRARVRWRSSGSCGVRLVGRRAVAGLERAIKAVVLELWGLFVDDGAVAVVAVVALLAVALFVQHQGDGHSIAGVLLIAGVLIAVWAWGCRPPGGRLASPNPWHRADPLRRVRAARPESAVARRRLRATPGRRLAVGTR